MNEKLSPPPEVVRIARRLAEAGHEVWAVGGAVRDALAGLPPGDWDLTTSARPPQMRAVFRRIVPVGIEHGTVGILGADGCMYEVTTFRRDVETDGRHAVVHFADTLEEDLARRDFTINAVAWSPLSGELRDPYQGREDLERGVLRAVGEPSERFREDRLRVLRALRFAGRFALEVEGTTWDAARASAGELGMLSAERVREELVKVLGGAGAPSRALELYARSGVLAHLYPELLPVADGGVGWSGLEWAEVLRVIDSLPRRRPLLRLAALFHALPRGVDLSAGRSERAAVAAARARQVMRRLKASNADADLVVHLLAQDGDLPTGAPDPAVRRWLRRIGPEHARNLFRLRLARSREAGDRNEVLDALARVRRVARQRPALAVSDLAIGGRELREAGIPPGPRYGEILATLLERVLDEPAVNRADTLLEMVRGMETE